MADRCKTTVRRPNYKDEVTHAKISKVNWICEQDLDQIPRSAKTVTLDTDTYIYRGFGVHRKDTKLPNRAIFFGSALMADKYTANGDVPRYLLQGSLYRYRPKRPLKLWVLNAENALSLLDSLIKSKNWLTAEMLILSYGYTTKKQLDQVLANVIPLDDIQLTKYLERAVSQQASCEHLVPECLYSGRTSFYEYDKPLLELLSKTYLKDYDGMLAWTDYEIETGNRKKFGHDIVIFKPNHSLQRDQKELYEACQPSRETDNFDPEAYENC